MNREEWSVVSTRAIPDTRRGRAYRNFLIVGGVLALIGLADALRALAWTLLNGPAGVANPAIRYLEIGLRIAAWGLFASTAWRAVRHKAIPPTWAILTLVALTWVVILV
jgi:hypothetical protein